MKLTHLITQLKNTNSFILCDSTDEADLIYKLLSGLLTQEDLSSLNISNDDKKKIIFVSYLKQHCYQALSLLTNDIKTQEIKDLDIEKIPEQIKQINSAKEKIKKFITMLLKNKDPDFLKRSETYRDESSGHIQLIAYKTPEKIKEIVKRKGIYSLADIISLQDKSYLPVGCKFEEDEAYAKEVKLFILDRLFQLNDKNLFIKSQKVDKEIIEQILFRYIASVRQQDQDKLSYLLPNQLQEEKICQLRNKIHQLLGLGGDKNSLQRQITIQLQKHLGFAGNLYIYDTTILLDQAKQEKDNKDQMVNSTEIFSAPLSLIESPWVLSFGDINDISNFFKYDEIKQLKLLSDEIVLSKWGENLRVCHKISVSTDKLFKILTFLKSKIEKNIPLEETLSLLNNLADEEAYHLKERYNIQPIINLSHYLKTISKTKLTDLQYFINNNKKLYTSYSYFEATLRYCVIEQELSVIDFIKTMEHSTLKPLLLHDDNYAQTFCFLAMPKKDEQRNEWIEFFDYIPAKGRSAKIIINMLRWLPGLKPELLIKTLMDCNVWQELQWDLTSAHYSEILKVFSDENEKLAVYENIKKYFKNTAKTWDAQGLEQILIQLYKEDKKIELYKYIKEELIEASKNWNMVDFARVLGQFSGYNIIILNDLKENLKTTIATCWASNVIELLNKFSANGRFYLYKIVEKELIKASEQWDLIGFVDVLKMFQSNAKIKIVNDWILKGFLITAVKTCDINGITELLNLFPIEEERIKVYYYIQEGLYEAVKLWTPEEFHKFMINFPIKEEPIEFYKNTKNNLQKPVKDFFVKNIISVLKSLSWKNKNEDSILKTFEKELKEAFEIWYLIDFVDFLKLFQLPDRINIINKFNLNGFLINATKNCDIKAVIQLLNLLPTDKIDSQVYQCLQESLSKEVKLKNPKDFFELMLDFPIKGKEIEFYKNNENNLQKQTQAFFAKNIIFFLDNLWKEKCLYNLPWNKEDGDNILKNLEKELKDAFETWPLIYFAAFLELFQSPNRIKIIDDFNLKSFLINAAKTCDSNGITQLLNLFSIGERTEIYQCLQESLFEAVKLWTPEEFQTLMINFPVRQEQIEYKNTKDNLPEPTKDFFINNIIPFLSSISWKTEGVIKLLNLFPMEEERIKVYHYLQESLYEAVKLWTPEEFHKFVINFPIKGKEIEFYKNTKNNLQKPAKDFFVKNIISVLNSLSWENKNEDSILKTFEKELKEAFETWRLIDFIAFLELFQLPNRINIINNLNLKSFLINATKNCDIKAVIQLLDILPIDKIDSDLYQFLQESLEKKVKLKSPEEFHNFMINFPIKGKQLEFYKNNKDNLPEPTKDFFVKNIISVLNSLSWEGNEDNILKTFEKELKKSFETWRLVDFVTFLELFQVPNRINIINDFNLKSFLINAAKTGDINGITQLLNLFSIEEEPTKIYQFLQESLYEAVKLWTPEEFHKFMINFPIKEEQIEFYKNTKNNLQESTKDFFVKNIISVLNSLSWKNKNEDSILKTFEKELKEAFEIWYLIDFVDFLKLFQLPDRINIINKFNLNGFLINATKNCDIKAVIQLLDLLPIDKIDSQVYQCLQESLSKEVKFESPKKFFELMINFPIKDKQLEFYQNNKDNLSESTKDFFIKNIITFLNSLSWEYEDEDSIFENLKEVLKDKTVKIFDTFEFAMFIKKFSEKNQSVIYSQVFKNSLKKSAKTWKLGSFSTLLLHLDSYIDRLYDDLKEDFLQSPETWTMPTFITLLATSSEDPITLYTDFKGKLKEVIKLCSPEEIVNCLKKFTSEECIKIYYEDWQDILSTEVITQLKQDKYADVMSTIYLAENLRVEKTTQDSLTKSLRFFPENSPPVSPKITIAIEGDPFSSSNSYENGT